MGGGEIERYIIGEERVRREMEKRKKREKEFKIEREREIDK